MKRDSGAGRGKGDRRTRGGASHCSDRPRSCARLMRPALLLPTPDARLPTLSSQLYPTIPLRRRRRIHAHRPYRDLRRAQRALARSPNHYLAPPATAPAPSALGTAHAARTARRPCLATHRLPPACSHPATTRAGIPVSSAHAWSSPCHAMSQIAPLACRPASPAPLGLRVPQTESQRQKARAGSLLRARGVCHARLPTPTTRCGTCNIRYVIRLLVRRVLMGDYR